MKLIDLERAIRAPMVEGDLTAARTYVMEHGPVIAAALREAGLKVGNAFNADAIALDDKRFLRRVLAQFKVARDARRDANECMIIRLAQGAAGEVGRSVCWQNPTEAEIDLTPLLRHLPPRASSVRFHMLDERIDIAGSILHKLAKVPKGNWARWSTRLHFDLLNPHVQINWIHPSGARGRLRLTTQTHMPETHASAAKRLRAERAGKRHDAKFGMTSFRDLPQICVTVPPHDCSFASAGIG